MRRAILEALRARYEAEIAEADATANIYLENSVGIGEHPDITQAMQDELDKIARWHDQIEVINKYLKK